MLLFIQVAEMLATKIRKFETIKGITVNDTKYKLSMMADYMTLITKNLDSLDKAIQGHMTKNKIYCTVYGEMFATYLFG